LTTKFRAQRLPLIVKIPMIVYVYHGTRTYVQNDSKLTQGIRRGSRMANGGGRSGALGGGWYDGGGSPPVPAQAIAFGHRRAGGIPNPNQVLV